MEFNFKTQFVVARKIEKVFRNDFKADENHFYDHLVGKAFRDVLHRYKNNYITFSVRGSRKRQQPMSNAIMSAKQLFTERYGQVDTKVDIQPQSPKGEPCLSVIDYMIWAIQRAYTKGEMRYYDFVQDKVRYILDLYDFDKFPKNHYYHALVGRQAGGRSGIRRRRKANLFHIDKTTPL